MSGFHRAALALSPFSKPPNGLETAFLIPRLALTWGLFYASETKGRAFHSAKLISFGSPNDILLLGLVARYETAE